MNYWVESSDASSAVVWVKVPSIPKTGTQLYMYWGNPGASGVSNGGLTFEFFDDFPGNSLDTTKWTTTGTATVSNSVITFQPSSASYQYLTGKTSYGVGYATRFLLKTSTQADSQEIGFRANIGSRVALSSRSGSGWGLRNYDGSGYNDAGATVDYTNYHVYDVSRDSSTLTQLKIDNSAAIQNSGHVPMVSLPPGCVAYYPTDRIYMDWFSVRKSVLPEPIHGAWGSI